MADITVVNITSSDVTISDLSHLILAPGQAVSLTDQFPNEVIGSSEILMSSIEDGLVLLSDGVNLLSKPASIATLKALIETINPKDLSGKLRVHQTSRRFGTAIYWTGEGDDTSSSDLIGGGTPIVFYHEIGDPDPEPIYIDFNIAENRTFVHEGYLTWKDAVLDTITLEIVPRVVSTTTSSGTYYNLYNNYLVVPAAGDGTLAITSDITTHSGGLVYMPDDDLGNPPTAFWDATWNSTTKQYENITAAPNGDGRYNMFGVEVSLAKFINNVPLLSNGFIALNSSDTDELGQGMRVKVTADTNKDHVGDHTWSMASILCMHRAKSV